jgi:hypothetical protein
MCSIRFSKLVTSQLAEVRKMIISLDYIDTKNKSDATPEIDTYAGCCHFYLVETKAYYYVT